MFERSNFGARDAEIRHVGYCYSERGEVLRKLRGADVRARICNAIRPAIVTSRSPPTAVVLAPSFPTCPDPGPQRDYTEESFIYDGLGRLVRRLDERKTPHIYQWTARDELATEEVGDPSCGPPETFRRAYDDHGQLAALVKNGAHTTSYVWGPWGRSVRESKTGRSPSYAIFSLVGSSLWQRDSAGDETVLLEDLAARTSANLALRYDVATGAIEQEYDLTTRDFAARPISRVLSGRDLQGRAAEQQRSWERTAFGSVASDRHEDGRLITYEDQNLVGWPGRICENGSCAWMHYNARGNSIRIYDPSEQVTNLRWNAFDEMAIAQYPGDANATVYSYDTLGRLTNIKDPGGSQLLYHYNGRNDRVRVDHAIVSRKAQLGDKSHL